MCQKLKSLEDKKLVDGFSKMEDTDDLGKAVSGHKDTGDSVKAVITCPEGNKKHNCFKFKRKIRGNV